MELFRVLLLLALLVPSSLMAQADSGQRSASCVAVGEWLLPGTGTAVGRDAVLSEMISKRVVLLGEHHDNRRHHDWQLQVLQQLYQRTPDLVIGLEMLPRAVQPQLDRYLSGKTDLQSFLEEAEWDRHWSFSADYYTPLLEYAQKKRIPVRALNVTRDRIEAAVAQGWEAAPAGLTPPAKATRAYLRHLVISFQRHKLPGTKLDMTVEGPAFRRFVQKQLLWDRAMAEGIDDWLKLPHAPPLVIAFIGSGHLMYDYGVPHQLRSLGIDDALTAIPWDRHLDCSMLPGIADLVYGAEE